MFRLLKRLLFIFYFNEQIMYSIEYIEYTGIILALINKVINAKML